MRHNQRMSAGAVCLCAAAGAIGQVSFRPATELVAAEPPPGVVPLNAGQVILGIAQRYVYAAYVAPHVRIQTTSDFIATTVLALPPGGLLSIPIGVSDDGERVLGLVGYSPTSVTRAVLWQGDGAPVVYAVGSALNQRPQQADAACDHWVITTGLSAFDSRTYLAGLDGFEEVVGLEGDEPVSMDSQAISPDGRTVAGQFNGNGGPAFVWSEAEGARKLPAEARLVNLPQFVCDGGGTVVCGGSGEGDVSPENYVTGVYTRGWLRTDVEMWGSCLSRDGGVLLGYTGSAVWWTPTLGREDLSEALAARGINLRGWTLREARYISTNGRTIVGRGTAPQSNVLRWWVATIEPLAAADIGKGGGRGGSDGNLDNNDFIVFIDRFFGHDVRADVGKAGGEHGPDGVFDNNDFCAFISLFFSGEP